MVKRIVESRDERLRRYLANRQKQYEHYQKIIDDVIKDMNEGMTKFSEGELSIGHLKKRQAYPIWALDNSNRKFIERLWSAAWLAGQKFGRVKTETTLLESTKPRLPLSDDALRKIWNSNATTGKSFARAVEAAHGITYKRAGITCVGVINEQPDRREA